MILKNVAYNWITKIFQLSYTCSNMPYYDLNDSIPNNAIESPNASISSQFITLFNLERCTYMKSMMGCGLDTFNKAMVFSLECWTNDTKQEYVHTDVENEMIIEISNTRIVILE